jgi:hypothetical protein
MSRALIPLAPNEDRQPLLLGAGRASADFIAHLIATSEKLPQTRVRRRAEPEEAAAAYGALGHAPDRSGDAISRSL